VDYQYFNKEVIQDNYHQVLKRIHKVAEESGRNPAEIRLVVVTKTKSVEAIQAVIDAGAADLGENYVEEAIPKIKTLASNQGIYWHMIGHIQRRKAQDVCEYFQYIHTLDSLRLAERLSRFAVKRTNPIPVWMEFNVGGEETKSGWNIANKNNWPNILADIEKILQLPGFVFLGVMAIPPYNKNPEASRPYFRRLREFQAFIHKNLGFFVLQELSIGMSGDFEVAIQEGSTCVRIGQAILGPRPG
jgi:pyridoxal phosphate enzyme (YggS family)